MCGLRLRWSRVKGERFWILRLVGSEFKVQGFQFCRAHGILTSEATHEHAVVQAFGRNSSLFLCALG